MSDRGEGNRELPSSYLKPYEAPEWAKSLKNVPEFRVKLANANTPIHEWRLPGLPDHVSLSIKRDDMTGCSLSGNKVRKLEFLMADALLQGCRHVMTCGGIQSNHCRAVAVSARQLGLQPHLVLSASLKTFEEAGRHGNVLLERMCGAYTILTPHDVLKVPHLKLHMDKLAQRISQSTGQPCYNLPCGGSNSLGIFGDLEVFKELVSQDVLENFDDVVLAAGTGGTTAGLAIANFLTGSKLRIHGILTRDNGEHVYQHIREMLTTLDVAESNAEDFVDIIDGHYGLGYGLSTQQELEFLTDVSVNTGIILDPVYTGKAVRGMLKELQDNPSRFQGNRILFLHTGGLFGIFNGKTHETLLKSGSSTTSLTMWNDLEIPPF